MSGYNLPPGVSQRDIDSHYGFDDDLARLEEEDDDLEDDEPEDEDDIPLPDEPYIVNDDEVDP